MQKYFILAIAALILFACAPSPKEKAEAFAVEIQAQQDAADQEQARLHEQEWHELEMAKERSLAEQKYKAMNSVIKWAGVFGSITLSISILALGIGFGIGAIGTGRAVARGAMVRSNLIRLDPVTRQFPLIIHQVGRYIVSLTNMNDGSTLLLDRRNEADRQKISAMGLTQVAGVIASEASKSTDPGGVAAVCPPVIAGDHAIYDELPSGINSAIQPSEVKDGR